MGQQSLRMSIIVLIPAAVCVVALCFWTPARVFLNVALPVLLLLPIYFYWKVALLPPIDFAEAALLPLGVGMGIREWRRWRFSWTDAFVVLFMFSSAQADHALGRTTNSIFELFYSLSRVLVPYMAGKLLIEQNRGRQETLRRVGILTGAAAVIGFYEWRTLENPFRVIFAPFFRSQENVWTTQVRNGFARITGPYADAELAGLLFLLGFLLMLFVTRREELCGSSASARVRLVRLSTAAAGTLLIALLLTQSRGPELGLLFAAPIALIGRGRNVMRAAFTAGALILVVGGAAYWGLTRYAATKAPTSEEQETAAYRAVMIEDYVPLAERSGPWGYGPQFPVIGKYASVDNEYLYLALTQGYIGLGAFVLLIGSTLYTLVLAAFNQSAAVDREFAFTLIGTFVGFLVTIATVYLDHQPLIFFFLLVGWAQALRRSEARDLRPVFQQVYT